jgi:cardiolipin synthase A/B
LEPRTKRRLKIIIATIILTVLAVAVIANFSRPEKKVEHTLAHQYTIDEPQFRREMGVLLGPGITEGNDVDAFDNGDEIFPPMLEAIAAAEKTINFETYIYWSGEVGQKFADALAERAKAGVRVNIIIDWVGGMKMDEAQLKEMEEAGAHIEWFRPLRWYNLSRLNNRTHRKLLIVDGKVGFTGGVGVADVWQGHAQDPDHWRDMHFRARGPVVAQMQAAFNDNWIKSTGEVLNGEEYFPRLEKVGNMDAHLFISSPTGGSESMHLFYLMAIAAAQRSIDMHASYFVPDELTDRALRAALKRGVKVRVIVPGEHIDSETVRFASKKLWGPLLKEGAEVYEYEPTMMHVKMMVVDDLLVSVGSTNFDQRSFSLNDEASLNVYDADFARRMTAVFQEDMKHCKQYDYAMWERRPWKQKFMESVVMPLRSQL